VIDWTLGVRATQRRPLKTHAGMCDDDHDDPT
jgi:hypothetical protein